MYKNASQIIKDELNKTSNEYLALNKKQNRLTNILFYLMRKFLSQKTRLDLGEINQFRKSINYSIRIFALDYFIYILKKNPKIPYHLFPKKDCNKIDYFLRIMIRNVIKKYLTVDDFEGRWEVFEKIRNEIGKKIEFDFLKNTWGLDGFKSTVYPDTGVYPDCYNFKKLTKKSYQTIFDLGSFIGDTVYYANRFLKPHKIYAFEPDPDNMRILKENLRLNNLEEKVTPVPLATSNKSGYVYFQKQAAGSTIIGEQKKEKNLIKVKTITIDEFVAQKKIKKVDLIKMDIEGAEFDTLKGAIKTLKRDKPDLIITIYHKGEHFFEIPGWLKKVVPEYNLRFWAFNQASPIIERAVAASVRRIRD